MIRIKHLKELKLPARASLYYTAAAAISKGMGLLFTPLFTRITSKEEYGYYTLYLTVLGISTVIVTSVATGSALYKGYRSFRGSEDELSASGFGISIALIPLIIMILLIFGDTVNFNPVLLPVLALQLVCDAAIGVRYAESRYGYSYRSTTKLTLASALLTPIVSIALLNVMGGALGRIYGLLAVSLGLALPTILRAIRKGPYSKRMWSFLGSYSLPLLPNAIATAVISQADKLILASYMGSGALASYAVAHSIGIGLTFVTGSLGAALQPWMMRKLEAGEYEKVGHTVTDISLGLSALGVFVVALAPEALALLTPRAYAVALPAVFPTALSVLPTFTLSMLAVIAVQLGKPYYASISSAVGAGANIISNVILIPRLSYFGAGVSLFLAYAVANIMCFLLLRGRKEARYLYPPKLIAVFIGSALLSAVIARLYDNPGARIALLILPALLLLLVWKSAREYVGEG